MPFAADLDRVVEQQGPGREGFGDLACLGEREGEVEPEIEDVGMPVIQPSRRFGEELSILRNDGGGCSISALQNAMLCRT